MRPRVFIGSSTKGLSVAYALQNTLETDAGVTVWDQERLPAFGVNSGVAPEAIGCGRLGHFVFLSDDIVRIRGIEHAAVRDPGQRCRMDIP
jgi:hypothetical protein